MLEVFNFICQLAPAAHEFQISIFGFRVLGFLRLNGTFDGFDPEPFGRVVIEDNAQKFLTFQSSAPHEDIPAKNANVRLWHKADMSGSRLLLCKTHSARRKSAT
jgi:hypothetical protein